MTIKFELPSGDSSALYHIGTALRNIAIDQDAGYSSYDKEVKKTVTESVGEVTRTVTTEPVDTRSPAQIDQDDSDREDALIEEALKTGAAELQVPVSMLKGESKNASQEDVDRYAEAIKEHYGEDDDNSAASIEDITQAEINAGNLPPIVETAIVPTEINGTIEPPVIDDKLDKEGIPWDGRIHSRGKTRVAKGTLWRLAKRPADKTEEEFAAYVETVKAELLALMSVPVVEPDTDTPHGMSEANEATLPPVVEAITPPVIEPSAAAKAFDTAVLPTPPVVEAITPPVVETVTPPVVETAATGPKTFAELMKFITTNNKKLTKEVITEVLLANGIAAIPLLAARADLIPQVHAALVTKL